MTKKKTTYIVYLNDCDYSDSIHCGTLRDAYKKLLSLNGFRIDREISTRSRLTFAKVFPSYELIFDRQKRICKKCLSEHCVEIHLNEILSALSEWR